jgi:hypothetical protein
MPQMTRISPHSPKLKLLTKAATLKLLTKAAKQMADLRAFVLDRNAYWYLFFLSTYSYCFAKNKGTS